MIEVTGGIMRWRCPQPDKAMQRGCPDIKKDGRCIRKEWSGDITFLKGKNINAPVKAIVYCERIKATLHED
jgi:hypothetical protein